MSPSTATPLSPTGSGRNAPLLPQLARSALFVIGAVAVLFGAAILIWPLRTAEVVAALIAIYAIVAGAVFIGSAIFINHHGTGARIGQGLLGVLYVVAGIIALTGLQAAAEFLAVFIAVMIGLLWIVEGFVALGSLGSSGSKALTVLFALLSIIAGVLVITSPLWAAALLWLFLGLSLVVLGIINIVRAALAGRR